MTITTGVVQFVPADFTKDFPAFMKVSDMALQFNFALAQLSLNNTQCSIVRDVGTRTYLLYLATAHITAILNGINGEPPNPTLVGRITSANQGSVSVSTEFKTDSEAAAYWTQTQWGATFWTFTIRWRTARYIRSPFRGYGGGWGGWGGGFGGGGFPA